MVEVTTEEVAMRTSAVLHPVVLMAALPPATLALGIGAWVSGASLVGIVLAALALPLALGIVAPALVVLGIARPQPESPAPEVVVPDEVTRASAELRATVQGADPSWSPIVLRREAAVRLARGRLLEARALVPPAPLDELLTLSHDMRCAELSYWEALHAVGGELTQEAQEALEREALQRESAAVLRQVIDATPVDGSSAGGVIAPHHVPTP